MCVCASWLCLPMRKAVKHSCVISILSFIRFDNSLVWMRFLIGFKCRWILHFRIISSWAQATSDSFHNKNGNCEQFLDFPRACHVCIGSARKIHTPTTSTSRVKQCISGLSLTLTVRLWENGRGQQTDNLNVNVVVAYFIDFLFLSWQNSKPLSHWNGSGKRRVSLTHTHRSLVC